MQPSGGLGSSGEGRSWAVRGEGRPAMALLGNSGSPVALEGRGRAEEHRWKMVKLSGGSVQA